MGLEGRSIRNSIDKIKEKTEKNLSDGRPTYPSTDSYDMLFDDLTDLTIETDEKKLDTPEDRLAFLQSIGIDISGLFTGQSIGKATINSPTFTKEQARLEMQKALEESKELLDRAMDL